MVGYFTKIHRENPKYHKGILCVPLCNSLRYVGLVIVVLFLKSFPIHAQENTEFDIDLGGYVKELGQIAAGNDFSEIRYDNIFHHRLETDWTLSQHFEFRADIRNRLISGYSVRNTPGVEAFYEMDPNYMDLTWVWFDSETSILQSNIDRLHLSYINGPWEIHAGRQRVNWGRTFVWNPNDLFNNYAFLDFDYEERPGVDAFLAQYNWSYASSAEAGIRIGESWAETVIGGMVRTSLGSYDVQFIGGHYLEYLALGTGWAGYLKDAGFKGEITYFHPEDRFFENRGHFTATAGFDYMLNSGIYLQTELLYNGGYNRSLNPLDRLVRPPSADNLFIASSGILLNGSYQIHPLVSGNMSLLSSLDRSVFIFIPQISVSVTENMDFLLLSQLLKGSVFRKAVETPNLFFFRLKYSY